MKTPFNLLREACGLSLREAAELLNVRFDTARNWDHGRRPTPRQVLEFLHGWTAKIEKAAKEGLKIIRANPDRPVITLNYAVTDYDAQDLTLGWPFASMQHAMHRRLMTMLPADAVKKVQLVPRGTTPAGAAAADVHDAQ